MNEVRTRFAPSPTGLLHVGNARVALVNWLFAHQTKGKFFLRFDDTDVDRSTADFTLAIRQDLRWLGILRPYLDDEFKQMDRLDKYSTAAEKLKQIGRLYPCYETPDELERRRRLQASRHLRPKYDRAALRLTDEDRRRLESEGRRPHWRFLLHERQVTWNDVVRGPVSIDAESLSDPVLIREDGVPLYTLTSVVDDAEYSISHIIRGEDHLTNTAVQIQLFEALGESIPNFAHLSLLVGKGGEGLSKRTGALSLRSLREEGIEAMALNSLLANLGTSNPVQPLVNHDELLEHFSLEKFGKSPVQFDLGELNDLSAKVLHRMPFDVPKQVPEGLPSIRERLVEIGLTEADERFWLAVRGNIAHLDEAKTWWTVVRGPIAPVIEDAVLSTAARELLPEEPWSEATWPVWTGAVRERTGRSGKALFHPLRLALTGREHGPEMKNLLPLIGRERADKRLAGATA
ncbi:MAG TPA: glutamate--tRNA ligase [Alphaproteobacteria bacterium]|jgi:glutamyl-tRNA synthetase|nr:glutamate--tRNA ligase [Alphaproteobacteria bacterium]